MVVRAFIFVRTMGSNIGIVARNETQHLHAAI
jgi:hypothetical protein